MFCFKQNVSRTLQDHSHGVSDPGHKHIDAGHAHPFVDCGSTPIDSDNADDRYIAVL